MGRLRFLLCQAFTRKPFNAKRNFLTLKKILARNTDEFCKNTTLHGLKYVTSDQLQPTERTFFAASIIIVLLISGFFILKIYDKWATTPVILGINPEPTFITNEPFPAVTICNLNQALKSKAYKISNHSMEHAMLQLLCKNDANITSNNTKANWSSLEAFIINISQPCENMIIGCRFGAKEYDCIKFFYPIVTDEGLCCAFNLIHPSFMYISHTPLSLRNISPSIYEPVDWYAEQGYPEHLPAKFYPRTTAGTGESLGLSVTLDVEYDKYYCSSSNSIGFKISLHSPNESPNVRETGVLIAPGSETKLRIRPEKTETTQNLRSMHRKYRRCLFHDEGELRYFAHYTQRNCEMECVAEMLLKHCGCISFYMPRIFRNESICSIHAARCVEKVRLRTDPTIESCLDNCLPSCFDLTFIADVFAVPIASEGFHIENQMVQKYSAQYVRKNIAVVNMYFKEYSFRSSIQTEFIGISDFLSSVGGLMGLFLGFSFISIVELFYFALIRPCRKFFQRKKNSARTVEVFPLTEQKIRRSLRGQRKRRFSRHGSYRRKLGSLGNSEEKMDETYVSNELLQSITKSLEVKVEQAKNSQRVKQTYDLNDIYVEKNN